MIKDILVTLPTGNTLSFALDYAVSVARIFDAHLTGIVAVQDLGSAGSSFDNETVLDDYRPVGWAVAETAKVRFKETWRREGISAESMTLNAGAFSFSELLARTARKFDLSILPQPDPEHGRSAEIMINAALLGSGRPILIVPYFQESVVKFDRVLVCWNGSHNAARAIADGMPFLKRAKQVDVVTVAAHGSSDDVLPGMEIGRHLSRHGAAVEIRKIVAHNQAVSVRILSHAAQQSSDLIVMGGYGHSPLHNLVFGSATRDILLSTAIPILMSH